MKSFIIVWLGQLISSIGSGLTGFAISIWIYQQTGSVTLFALNAFLKFLPGIVLSPLAGLLADRHNRRRIMLLADSGAALSTLFVALMILTDQLALWHVYFAGGANALFGTFQGPAYNAAVSMLVPKKQFTRVSAMQQLGGQFSGLIAPPLSAFLLAAIGLPGIIVIDFTTFLFAVGTLLLLRLPALTQVKTQAAQSSRLHDMLQGWHYVTQQPALRGLLILSGLNLFLIAVNAVLSLPILLNLTSVKGVGVMALIFGCAGLLGSTLLTLWGGPKRRITGVFGAHLLIGLGLILFGLRPNLLLVTAAGFILSGTLPIRDGLTEAIWRSAVPLALQGRVFALLQIVSATSFGLAYLTLGPLADTLFEPLLVTGGPLTNSLGPIIGIGPGRGMALFVVLAGILTLVVTGISFLNRHVRLMDEGLTDGDEIV